VERGYRRPFANCPQGVKLRPRRASAVSRDQPPSRPQFATLSRVSSQLRRRAHVARVGGSHLDARRAMAGATFYSNASGDHGHDGPRLCIAREIFSGGWDCGCRGTPMASQDRGDDRAAAAYGRVSPGLAPVTPTGCAVQGSPSGRESNNGERRPGYGVCRLAVRRSANGVGVELGGLAERPGQGRALRCFPRGSWPCTTRGRRSCPSVPRATYLRP